MNEHPFVGQPGSNLCVCGEWDHHPVHGPNAPMTLCQPCVLDALTAEGEHLGQYWEIES